MGDVTMAWDDAWNSEAAGGMLQPGVVRGDEYYDAIAHARARRQAEAAEQAVREAQAMSAAQAARYAAARDDGSQYVEAMQRLMYGEPRVMPTAPVTRRAAAASPGVYVPGYGVVDAALDPAAAGWRDNLPGPLPRRTWADYTYANNVNPAPGMWCGGLGGATNLVGYPSSHPLVLQTGMVDTLANARLRFMNEVLPFLARVNARGAALAGGASTGGGVQRSRGTGSAKQPATPNLNVQFGKTRVVPAHELEAEMAAVNTPDAGTLARVLATPAADTPAAAPTALDVSADDALARERVSAATATPASAETWVPGVGFVPDPSAESSSAALPTTGIATGAAALGEAAFRNAILPRNRNALDAAIKRGMASSMAKVLPRALARQLVGLTNPVLGGVSGYLTARELLSNASPTVRQIEDAYGDYLRYGGEDDMYVDPAYIEDVQASSAATPAASAPAIPTVSAQDAYAARLSLPYGNPAEMGRFWAQLAASGSPVEADGGIPFTMSSGQLVKIYADGAVRPIEVTP